jgi:hypothetical protein
VSSVRGRLLIALVALLAACQPEPSERRGAAPREVEKLTPAATGTPKPAPVEPETLLRHQESAYGASLLPTPSALLVVTRGALVRLERSGAVRTFPGAFDVAPALLGGELVTHHDGALWAVSVEDGTRRRLAPSARAPRYLVSDGSELVAVSRAATGQDRLELVGPQGTRVLHESKVELVSPSAAEGLVYFVEAGSQASYRIGRLALADGALRFTDERPGRPPSTLVATSEGVTFYDGTRRSVVRLSPELGREDMLAKGTICSPLAVARDVYCAHVGGLSSVRSDGGGSRQLAVEATGPVAALAADEERVFWVGDAGAEALVVRALPLGAPSAPRGTPPAPTKP